MLFVGFETMGLGLISLLIRGTIKLIGYSKDIIENSNNRYDAKKKGNYTYYDSNLATRSTETGHRLRERTYLPMLDTDGKVKQALPDIQYRESYYIDCTTGKIVANASQIYKDKAFREALAANDGKEVVPLPEKEIKFDYSDYLDGKYGVGKIIPNKHYYHKATGRKCFECEICAYEHSSRLGSVSYLCYMDLDNFQIIDLTKQGKQFVDKARKSNADFNLLKVNNVNHVINYCNNKIKANEFTLHFDNLSAYAKFDGIKLIR